MNIQQVMSICYELTTKGIRYSLSFNEVKRAFYVFVSCRTPEQFEEVYKIVSFVDFVDVKANEEEFILECENGFVKLEKWWTA